MLLKDQVLADMKTSMKERNADVTNALRFLQAAIKNREIELRPNSISEDEVLGVVKKLIKQRKESIEQYQLAGRQDLVDNESKELAVLERYLPAQMGRDKVEEIVAAVIADLKATTVKEMGAVMKECMVRTAGSADNKMISEIIKAKLQ